MARRMKMEGLFGGRRSAARLEDLSDVAEEEKIDATDDAGDDDERQPEEPPSEKEKVSVDETSAKEPPVEKRKPACVKPAVRLAKEEPEPPEHATRRRGMLTW